MTKRRARPSGKGSRGPQQGAHAVYREHRGVPGLRGEPPHRLLDHSGFELRQLGARCGPSSIP